jgi:hypothetical protein
MRVFVCLFASLAIFAGCVGGWWWFYWPTWQIEARVKSRLSDPRAARFSGIVYDKKTGTACGYVSAQGTGGAPARTHFILLPDGELRLDPKDPIVGSTTQQLESLRKHADYLALAYARCYSG